MATANAKRGTQQDFVFSLSSYSDWGTDGRYARSLFECLARNGYVPERLDDRDPPRRLFSGTETDLSFWSAKPENAWSRWLFIRARADHERMDVTVHWVDRSVEPILSRGDHHSLYAVIRTARQADLVDCWQALCQTTNAFHGFLDYLAVYNFRAHQVSPDGTVAKNPPRYLDRLPGFFAHNFFGGVYLARWGESVAQAATILPTLRVEKGLFVSEESGLSLEWSRDQPHSANAMRFTEALGSADFHLPGRNDLFPSAPRLEEFLRHA